jgi:aryl-alcohol dehydrogenase-like predicted oxidoreductase
MLAGTRTRLGDDSTARSATDQLDQIWYDDPSDWNVVDAVRSVAEGRGVKPAQIAMAWLLANPTVTSPIVGATKLEHLDDAVAAVAIDLSDAEMDVLEASYRPHAVKGIGHPGSGGLR